MKKPHIYKQPGEQLYLCSIALPHGVGQDPLVIHGFGATMREAYMDFCVKIYGERFPKL